MENNTLNQISKNIKKYRLLHQMTQETLAAKLHLDTQYYAQLERGERNFTLEKIIRLCEIFDIGIEDIIKLAPPCPENTGIRLQNIISMMEPLSDSQLLLVEKFIREIIPYAK